MEPKKQTPSKDQIEKKDEEKSGKESISPEMSEELFAQIQNQNMGDGLIELPDEKIEKPEPQVSFKVGKDIKTSGKYSEQIMKDIMSNPAKYKFTSKKHGTMNLKDAMDKGYNPDTDEFDKPRRKSKEELMEGLSDSDKESINNMTDPANAKIPEKDAEKLGVKDSRFIKKTDESELFHPQETAPQGETGSAEDEESLLAMLGGKA